MRGLPLAFLALLAAGFSAMIGGSGVGAPRAAVPENNALAVTFLRFLGASTVMLAFTLPRRKIRIELRDYRRHYGRQLVSFAVGMAADRLNLLHRAGSLAPALIADAGEFDVLRQEFLLQGIQDFVAR